MKVVAAVDKFRGTATGAEVANAIGQACWELGHDCVELALADGGEGLLDVLGGPNRTTTVTGPLGTPIERRVAAPTHHGDHRDGASERAGAGRRRRGQRPDERHHRRHGRADRRRARRPARRGSSSASAARRRPTAGSVRSRRSAPPTGCAASNCSSPATSPPASRTRRRCSARRRARPRLRSRC